MIASSQLDVAPHTVAEQEGKAQAVIHRGPTPSLPILCVHHYLTKPPWKFQSAVFERTRGCGINIWPRERPGRIAMPALAPQLPPSTSTIEQRKMLTATYTRQL